MSGQSGKELVPTALHTHVESHKQGNIDHFIIDTCADELYYCDDCAKDFDSLEAYNAAHSGPDGCSGVAESRSTVTVHAIEIKNEPFVEDDTIEVDPIVEEEEEEEDEFIELDEASEPPLWDVLDDDDDRALPTNEEEELIAELDDIGEAETEKLPNKSERYFCFDCHSIFETRQSAEEHSCPQAEASASKTSAKLSKTATPARRKLPTSSATSSSGGSTATICHICNTKFSSAKCLKFHMRIHNKHASKSIQDALPVGAHQQYSELDQFYCEICNKSFEQNLLNVHKQMHQSQKHFLCGTCNRKFDDLVNYEMHLKIHERNAQANKTSNSNNVSASKKSADGKEKPGFACQYCGRVFSRPYEKVKHERVHTGEKPYSCEVCGKTFRVSYSLTLHLRTHTNIRPYVCTTCNKRFKSHPVYAHHLRIHSAERQYTCDQCPKSFRTSVQLYAHKNTHTKPFQCAVCNRPFASLYAVKAHMATHRTTDAKSVTSATMRSQFLANKYWCVTCGAEYSRPFALRHHMKSAHGHPDDADTRLAKVGAPDMENEDEDDVNDNDDEITVPDTETAVLIAAAEADAAYMVDDIHDVQLVGVVPKYEECIEVSTDAFDVESFQNEEIITDWLK